MEDMNIPNQAFKAPFPPIIPKTNIFKYLFFISIGILLLIIIVGSYFLLNKYKQRRKTSIPQSNTSSIPETAPVTSQKTQIYKSHFGEFQLQIPDRWKQGGCSGVGCPFNIIPFNASSDTENIIVANEATLNTDFSKKLNFNIPSINDDLNASFDKNPEKATVSFVNRGAYYSFDANYSEGLKLGYSADTLDQVLKTIVTSITFLNEPSTCKEPALLPLINFPDNFSLYNYHDSDSTDPVYSYWPYTKSQIDPNYPLVGQDLKDASVKDSHRGFMVNYIKDENAFIGNSTFLKSIVPIFPNPDLSNDGYGDKTGLWHLNCIETQEDGPTNELPYHISDNNSDLFAVNLYGNAVNPQSLWNVSKWNIQLLQSTRGKVYIKRGSLFQAYKAIDYFATMPTAYGGKPAIYLYSPQQQSVSVEIHPKGLLIKTDDIYNSSINGWQVTAGPKGIIDSKENYLYYEAMLPVPTPLSGYVVPYSQLFNFSKNYVKELGLNEEESNEFVTFWKSKLPKAPFYLVSNLDQKTISEIYPLKIIPFPDTLIRVELYFKPLPQKISISQPKQVIPTKRKGFVAVEWGGIFDSK